MLPNILNNLSKKLKSKFSIILPNLIMIFIYFFWIKPGGYAYFDASAKIAGARGSYFIERHIFSGNHELLDVFGFLEAVKTSDFELIFLHNDRHSYYLTLLHWAQNLDAHKDEIIKRWGTVLYRKFQLYFWGCCFGMLHNEIQAYRLVLRKRTS